jgi:flagellar motor switch/type III secretory pathway protein FliN
MSTANSTPSTPTSTGHTDVRGAAAQLEALMTPTKVSTQKGGEATAGTGEQTPPGETDTTDTVPTGETEEQEEEVEEPETEEEEPSGEIEEVPDDAKFKVGESEITLGELKKGYLRESDYTRKTQELATQRKNFESASNQELGSLQGERQQLAQALHTVQDYLTNLMPAEPN